MKNIFLITTLLIAAMGMNSCKDKCPEPDLNQERIEKYFGTWISLDSFVSPKPDGGFNYLKDTFLIARISKHRSGAANCMDWISQSKTFGIESVDNEGNALLIGGGPSQLSFGREYRVNFFINETRDTLIIDDYSTLSHRHRFNNVFYRKWY